MLPRVLLSFSPAACRRLPQPLKSLYLQGLPAIIEGSWVGAIDGEFPTLNAKATARRPLCGASRHGFEAAKVGNRLLIFRVTAIAACLRLTQNGHIVPHNLTRKGPREFVPPGSFFVFPSGIRPGLAGVFQLSAPFLEVSGRGEGDMGELQNQWHKCRVFVGMKT